MLPSFSEGLGIVCLEALACGKPAVVTRETGLSEIVEDRVNGLLVDVEDVHGLANAITELLSNPSFGRRLGAAGREIVAAKFMPETIIPQWLEMLGASNGSEHSA